MILSRKLATSTAFFVALAASYTPTTIGAETTNGISLSDYDSILFTDIRKELGTSLSDDEAEHLWREATAIEWKSSKEEDQAAGLRRANSATPVAFPYVVCQKDPTSGYEFKQAVASEFDDSIDNQINVYNGKNMACVMISASPSVARRVAASSLSLLVQPLFPAMKVAAGTVDKIMDEDSRDDDGKLSVHLSALLCPGGSSTRDEKNAENLGRSIVDAIRPNNEDFVGNDEEKRKGEESVFALSKRFLRLSDDDDNERSELWKSAFVEALSSSSYAATADHRCDDMFSKTFMSSGYKGESFSVGKRLENDETEEDISVPIDASPSCLLSLIAGIAASPEVCFVEVSPEMKLLNAQAQWIIQSGVEDKRPWFDSGLDGTGQVVAVSDSGLDMYNCYFWDASGNVKPGGTIEDDARKVVQYNYRVSDTDDKLIGHGTHVCGTVAGRRAKNGEAESTGEADGMAREAKISMFGIGVGPLILPPRNPKKLFGPGQEAEARIHSASWGANEDKYESNARNFDSWIVDNPDFLSVVAAGNTGANTQQIIPEFDIPNSVGTPATAKNIIAVGATESYGPELNEPGMIGYDYLAYFSSRGPTADGRTKPDVTAPGFNILSAKSHGKEDTYSCDDSRGTKFMAGTSMACPAVSGTTALVRQYFVDGWYPSGKPNKDDSMIPSAALMKAVLLNGAQYLKGVNNKVKNGKISKVSPYDNAQNFGRVSLIDSLYLEGKNDMSVYVQDYESVGVFNKRNAFNTTVDTTKCTSKSLSVTLVWTDPVGFPFCRKCSMNDIDLVVTKNGEVFFPNGLSKADDINNNERVQMDVENGDELVVVVSADNLVTRSQDYALVMTGCFNVPS